jgi:ribosomal protein S18 acetylase RimI-like enzyme
MKRQPYNKLQVLYVLPASQGKSVGYQLASRALEWLGTERDIALEVVQYNETAIRFYKRLGFEITKEVHDPIADLPSGASMPEYQMVKKATT